MLISQPISRCLTNHSELCMSRLLNNQPRRISIYRLQRRPYFGFESSVSSTPMTSGDPVTRTDGSGIQRILHFFLILTFSSSLPVSSLSPLVFPFPPVPNSYPVPLNSERHWSTKGPRRVTAVSSKDIARRNMPILRISAVVILEVNCNETQLRSRCRLGVGVWPACRSQTPAVPKVC